MAIKRECVCFCAIGNVLEIDPNYLRLDDIIGEGQFGDVFRGTYINMVCTVILTQVTADIAF